MAQTFSQPNHLNKVQRSLWQTIVDWAIEVLWGIGGSFAPHESSTPAMTVTVDTGRLFVDGAIVSQSSQTTGTITAPVGNPRIDRVVINATTGAISVITGTPAASPSAPAITAGTYPICQVLLQTTSTFIINSMITDERFLWNTLNNPTFATLTVTGGGTLNGTFAGTPTFSGTPVFSAGLLASSASPTYRWRETDATTGNQSYDAIAVAEQFRLRLTGDDFSTATSWLTVDRTNNTADEIGLFTPSLVLQGSSANFDVEATGGAGTAELAAFESTGRNNGFGWRYNNTANTFSLQRYNSSTTGAEDITIGRTTGATTVNTSWTWTTASAGTAPITIESTEAGASSGPLLDLFRNSASPAASDNLGVYRYTGKDSGGNTTSYVQTLGILLDPTNGSEDGDWRVQTIAAGTLATRLTVQAGMYMAGATGSDQGAGTINATALYDDSVQIFPTQADTAVTLTNQTSVDFTIPSYAKKVSLIFSGLSTNGTSTVRIQLGDAGGVETTGYNGSTAEQTSGAVVEVVTNFTAGFDIITNNVATGVRYGYFELANLTGSTWVGKFDVGSSDTTKTYNGAGSKATSATTTTIRLTTANGTDQFDAGTVNCIYE